MAIQCKGKEFSQVSRYLIYDVVVQPLSCIQASLSMELSRQEYWSGLPFPSLGGVSNSGVEPMSPALAGRFFTTEPPGKTYLNMLL